MRCSRARRAWRGVGGVLVLSVLPGCAGQVAQERALVSELAHSREVQGEQLRRLQGMESRLMELERSKAASRVDSENAKALGEALQRFELLMLRVERSESPQCQAPPLAGKKALPPDATGRGSDDDPLRTLLEQIRSDPERWLKPLTRQQREAVRILIRPVRALDAQNPWQDAVWH